MLKYPYQGRRLRLASYAMLALTSLTLMNYVDFLSLSILGPLAILSLLLLMVMDFAVMHSRYTGNDTHATWNDVVRWNYDAIIDKIRRSTSEASQIIAPHGWNPVSPIPFNHYRIYLHYQSKTSGRKVSIVTILYWIYMIASISIALLIALSVAFIFVVYVAGTDTLPANIVRSQAALTTGIYGPGIIYFWIVFIAAVTVLSKLASFLLPDCFAKLRMISLREIVTDLGTCIGVGTLAGILLGAASPLFHSVLMSTFFRVSVRDYLVVIEPQTLVSTSFLGGAVGLSLGMLLTIRRFFSHFTNLLYREIIFTIVSAISCIATAFSAFASPNRMFHKIENRFNGEERPADDFDNLSSIDIYHYLVLDNQKYFPESEEFSLLLLKSAITLAGFCFIYSYWRRRNRITKRTRIKRKLTL
ncbi:hypothetical protein [Brevibacterium zhoupengii]|uniref:hypothetical protein n=1 Tax=Brevibacterium zhoupengii TaxID=2898795 RepID=UPI001E2A416B|nr:hypothetical protein [Brevibacterium zhoupengii]